MKGRDLPVGAMDLGPSPAQIKAEKDAELELMRAQENKQLEGMAMSMGLNDDGFVRSPAPGDKGKIIQYINTIEVEHEKIVYNPETGEPMLKIVGGDISKDMYQKLFGYLSHNASMTNYSEEDLIVEDVRIEAAKLLIRMCMDRDDYTPAFALELHNAIKMARSKLRQNRNGDERYYCAVDLLHEDRNINIGKEQSNTKNVLDRVGLRGSGGGKQ